MKKILEGIVGSTAYGLAHADSDLDYIGIGVRPTREVLGVFQPEETEVTKNPDRTIHEVRKFCHLAGKNNPTIMELLWLDEYEIAEDEALFLIDIREEFLSKKLRKTYGGYAKQQAERLLRRGDFAADLKKRQAKHGRHCTRLLLQGQSALETGKIIVRLNSDQVDFVRGMGEMAVNDIENFHAIIDDMDDKFGAMLDQSDLPEEPNWEAINDTLLTIRRKNYA